MPRYKITIELVDPGMKVENDPFRYSQASGYGAASTSIFTSKKLPLIGTLDTTEDNLRSRVCRYLAGVNLTSTGMDDVNTSIDALT